MAGPTRRSTSASSSSADEARGGQRRGALHVSENRRLLCGNRLCRRAPATTARGVSASNHRLCRNNSASRRAMSPCARQARIVLKEPPKEQPQEEDLGLRPLERNNKAMVAPRRSWAVAVIVPGQLTRSACSIRKYSSEKWWASTPTAASQLGVVLKRQYGGSK